MCIAILGAAALLAACSSGASPETTLTDQEAQGQRLFQANCASCHATTDDTIIVGPSLAAIGGRAEDQVPGQKPREYLRASIVEPDAYINAGFNDLMPKTFGRTFTEEELDALVAYLMTLE